MATRKVQFIITVGSEDLTVTKERVDESRPSCLLENGGFDDSSEALEALVDYDEAHTISTAELPAHLINQLELESYDGDNGATWCTYRAQEGGHIYTVDATVNGINQDVAWDDKTDAAVLKLVMAALREDQA
jgi:hypothetical protein